MIMHILLYIMEYLIIRFCMISGHMFLQRLFGYECIIYVFFFLKNDAKYLFF
jgi:hypothetical protein